MKGILLDLPPPNLLESHPQVRFPGPPLLSSLYFYSAALSRFLLLALAQVSLCLQPHRRLFHALSLLLGALSCAAASPSPSLSCSQEYAWYCLWRSVRYQIGPVMSDESVRAQREYARRDPSMRILSELSDDTDHEGFTLGRLRPPLSSARGAIKSLNVRKSRCVYLSDSGFDSGY
jgi:hypothetical protein